MRRNKNNEAYKAKLVETIRFLESNNDEHWCNYFQKSLDLYERGKIQKSIKWTLGAYGGMGSFNDTPSNFDEIRTSLYSQAKNSKSMWGQLF